MEQTSRKYVLTDSYDYAKFVFSTIQSYQIRSSPSLESDVKVVCVHASPSTKT